MDITTLSVGGQGLSLYLAADPGEWRQGLAGQDLDGIDGMLFRFGQDVQHVFHTHGVTVPILIAFYTSNGDLVDLTYLGPDTAPVRSRRPYRYALELVGRHATVAGATALLPDLAAGITVPP